MKRTAVINVVGLTSGLIGDHTPRIKAWVEQGALSQIKPAFPGVTCTAQSNYLTGSPPAKHGIVGNGWYDRDYSEVHFWKQSNQLVQQPKLWETLKQRDPDFSCAKLFWWYNMYSSVDYSITPRPMYPADGRKIFDIYTHPMSMREDIKRDLGEFPFHTFWGPKAGIPSSEWIAASAQWVEEHYRPTLNLIYLPHLDYNLQRLGPNIPAIQEDLKQIDRLVGELIDFFDHRDIQVILLSEYGITPVNQPVHLNRLFRQQGWLGIKKELGLELLDCGASRVFAVADHQVAHIYIRDSSLTGLVRDLLNDCPGVALVMDDTGKREWGIDHPRAGDWVAIADQDSWFTYYYWQDDGLAPDFARCVDIHRKPGYDPAELFIDPQLKFPAARVAGFLLKKKLGLRGLLRLIPLDASLVKGSHGRLPEDKQDWPVMAASELSAQPLESTDVYQELIRLIGD